MYLQFAPKMNDICAVKSIYLLHLKILLIWSLLVRKSFSVGTRRPVKVQY